MGSGHRGNLNVKSFFVAALILFLLFDVVLLFIYFTRVSLFDNLFKEKKFITAQNDNLYQLDPGKLRFRTGNIKQLVLSDVLLTGKITKSAYFEKQSQKMIVTVSFPRINSIPITADVVLGSNDRKIATLLAENGNIGYEKRWLFRSLSELLPYLKSGGPIIIGIYNQKAPPEIINHPTCDVACKNNMGDVNNLYDNNIQFVKGINENAQINNNLKIGPVSTLILYAQK